MICLILISLDRTQVLYRPYDAFSRRIVWSLTVNERAINLRVARVPRPAASGYGEHQPAGCCDWFRPEGEKVKRLSVPSGRSGYDAVSNRCPDAKRRAGLTAVGFRPACFSRRTTLHPVAAISSSWGARSRPVETHPRRVRFLDAIRARDHAKLHDALSRKAS